MGSTVKNHSTASRERTMTEMQNDERLARRVQAAQGRRRLRANPEDEQDAASRPRAKQQDVENNQSSAEPGGDRNRDQSGSGDIQVVLASARDLLRQCCHETRTRQFGVPMTHSHHRQRYGHEQHCDE